MIAEALRPERFASLSALQTEHSALQASLGKQPIDGSHAQIIAPLVQRAVETGAILDNREDRQSAQAIINYWMSRAAASVRLESSAPNPFADPDFDSLLKDFDSGTLTDATAAADRWLQSLPDEHRQVARRILLRLARLPADKRVFEAVPTSRTSLHDVDADTCLVDRMIDGLAQAGVIRVTPGSSTEVDQVALRSGNLVTDWGTYAEWLRARVEFRERAETWSLTDQPPVPACWMTKLGLPAFKTVNEQRLPGPPLLCGESLEEVRSYHDRNPLERKYIETCWLRERSKSQSDRTWKLIFGSLLLFAILCLGIAVLCLVIAVTQRNATVAAMKDTVFVQDSNRRALEARTQSDQVYTLALIQLLTNEDVEYSHHLAKKLLIIQTLSQLVSANEASFENARKNWEKLDNDLKNDPAVNYWFRERFFPHDIEGRTVQKRIGLLTLNWESSRENRGDLPVIGKYLSQFIHGDLGEIPEVKQRWYKLARDTAAELDSAAQADKKLIDVSGFKDLFWRLYSGEMVLVETLEVEEKMVAFGNVLTEWEQSDSRASPELKQRMQSSLDDLNAACEADLRKPGLRY